MFGVDADGYTVEPFFWHLCNFSQLKVRKMNKVQSISEELKAEKIRSMMHTLLGREESKVSTSLGSHKKCKIFPSKLSSLPLVTRMASVILSETCSAIWRELSPVYVKAPTTEEEWLEISKAFLQKWDFPHCLGAMDGKHVVLKVNDSFEWCRLSCHFSANIGTVLLELQLNQ